MADFAADCSAITPTAAAKEVAGDALSRAKAEKEREKRVVYPAQLNVKFNGQFVGKAGGK